jgi:hypothetical protein
VVISAALGACAATTPTERERALGKLPAQAQLVAAADGTALAAFRPAIDAARAFLPTNLACVVDAALTSEVIAVAVAPARGTTIILITRAHVSHCAALSQIGSDMFVATIGAAVLVDTPAASPLGHSRWARARSYLIHDPIAIAIEGEGQRVLAVAQPQPLAGWMTIDAVDIKSVEHAVHEWIDRQRTTALARFAGNLVVQAKGSQLLVRTAKLGADELALATVDLLRGFDAPPAAPAAALALNCPSGAFVIRCTGTNVVVRSLATTLRVLVHDGADPVVENGDIIGIRLSEDAQVLLRSGDIILGLDGHRITSAAQLHELAASVSERTTLAFRRDGTESIIELSE